MTHPTSLTTFFSNIANLTVTGVTREYTAPTGRIAPADMPLLFPRNPSSREGPLTVGGFGGGWPTLRCELVILVHPMELETDPTRWSDTITQMDNLSTALRSADLASGPVRWDMRGEVISLPGGLYWAIICEIETTG